MCFYRKIIERIAPFDALTDDEHRLLAPCAAAVYNAVTNVPDSHYESGFVKLRELGVVHGGPEVLPFIDAYLSYRSDVARRSGIVFANDAAKVVEAIQYEAGKPVYHDKAEVSVDESDRLTTLEHDLTEIATRLIRVGPDDMKKVYARVRSPKAGQIMTILYNCRNAIRQVFDNLS